MGESRMVQRACPNPWVGHPPGLLVLFLTEMWERFSFYGLGALLVLFLNSGALLPHRFDKIAGSGLVAAVFGVPQTPSDVQALSSQLWGLYVCAAYTTPLAGGFIADVFLGSRATLLCGGVLMAAGHGCMAFEPLFFFGLALVAIGNGAFKPNVSAQLSGLYAEHSPLRERGFGIFYAGINLGALFSPLVCGSLAHTFGYHAGFSAAGVGMLIGLFVYVMGMRWLPVARRNAPFKAELEETKLAHSRTHARQGAALLLLCALVVPYWSVYDQLSNVLMLVFRDLTDRTIFGHVIPPSWLSAVNATLCVLLVQPLAAFWTRQAARGAEPSPTQKMAMGCALLALGQLMLSAATVYATPERKLPLLVPLSVIFVITVGELCLSPVGLALVGGASRGSSSALGVWFLSGGVGGAVAGQLGTLYSQWQTHRFFFLLSAIAIINSLVFLLLGPLLQRMAASAGMPPKEPFCPSQSLLEDQEGTQLDGVLAREVSRDMSRELNRELARETGREGLGAPNGCRLSISASECKALMSPSPQRRDSRDLREMA